MTEQTPAVQAAPEAVVGAAAPTPVPPSAPVSEAPVASVEAIQAAPTPTAETGDKPAESAPAAPVANAPVEAAPAPEGDKKPDGEAAPVEPPKPEAPRYEFKMPEGVVADAPVMSAYTNILGKYNMPPEAGQELLDFHANQMTVYAERVAQSQQDQFSETRRGWVKEFEKMAGNRRDTMLNDAKWAVMQFGGDKKQVAELWNVLNFTGAGDHPAVIRAFANIAKASRERSAPQHGNPAVSAPTDPATRRYGKRA